MCSYGMPTPTPTPTHPQAIVRKHSDVCSHFGTGSVQVLPQLLYRRMFIRADFLPCRYDTADMYWDPSPSATSSSGSRVSDGAYFRWLAQLAPADQRVPTVGPRLLAPASKKVPLPKRTWLRRPQDFWYKVPGGRSPGPASPAFVAALDRRNRYLEWLDTRPEPWYR